ncbi:MAG: hypothetical protein IPM18_06275 [Phycisphaerales bacterium]|nr:hypothetical protein [Phycisphaerales bacterium]
MEITRHPLAGADTDQELGDLPADEALIGRLTRSFARFLPQGSVLAERFYERLFERHPELRRLFPEDLSEQRAKLLASLTWVIGHLQQPEKVRSKLLEMGRRHVAYGVQREHYPLVVAALVNAMGTVAGSDWSADLEADWLAALQLISERMCEAHNEVPPVNAKSHPTGYVVHGDGSARS